MHEILPTFFEVIKIAPILATSMAIIGGGGLIGIYKLLQQAISSKSFKKPLAIFSGSNSIYRDLIKLQGKTVSFDTVLDFCVWNLTSSRIVEETEYGEVLKRPPSELNNKILRIYQIREGGTLDSFVSLIVSLRDPNRLRFSRGGTGVIQVLLKGKFDVEVRAYSGPSTEFTLREAA